jgi:hypothetical protein
VIKQSQQHLEKANEGYFKHMGMSLKISAQLLSGALMAFIHALVPSLFKKNTSNKIKELYFFIENRNKNHN